MVNVDDALRNAPRADALVPGVAAGDARGSTSVTGGPAKRSRAAAINAAAGVRLVPKPDRRRLCRTAPTDLDIARRAYAVYEMRGRQDGRDLDDWLQAERELRNPEGSA